MSYFKSPHFRLFAICAIYLTFALIKGSTSLDGDEFSFISEPYEMLGGDYTVSYLKEDEYKKAFVTSIKSYWFFWYYRPMFAPIIKEEHKLLFAEEEERFGYQKPQSVQRGDPNSLKKYQSRLIVPEPDRWYQQSAGKPLLSAVLSIPQLLFTSISYSGNDILEIQFNNKVHPFFIQLRLVQILSGLISIILLYNIFRIEFSDEVGYLGAGIFAFLPLTISFFPDIHHDSILVPFIIASSYCLFKEKYIKGGLLFGLALASKNAAIFMLPAFFLYFLWIAYELKTQNNFNEACSYFFKKNKQLLIFVLLSIVTLAPFANPISYAIEILTPITQRDFDDRGAKSDHIGVKGEDVSRFMLFHDDAETENINKAGSVFKIIRDVLQFRKTPGFKSIFLLISILCVFLIIHSNPHNLVKLALVSMFMVMPYGLVFTYNMSYRSLLFTPFFAILCSGLLTRKHQVILMWLFLFLSALFCVELLTGHPEVWAPQ